MNLTYDLHIHSCLSPCGDDDMTPANLVGMAAVKGLDLIALTDHNSCRNCSAAMAWGEEYNVTVLPGMELCTSEEVHAVCLFPSLSDAMEFDAYVYKKLLQIKNNPAIFGKQQIMNAQEQIIDTEPFLLINSTDISFDLLWELVQEFHGVMFPAHIDKAANSLLSNLGFIPPDSKFSCAEVHDMKNLHRLQKENPYLESCRILCNSDAHYLEDIKEPYHTINAKSRNLQDIIDSLRAG